MKKKLTEHLLSILFITLLFFAFFFFLGGESGKYPDRYGVIEPYLNLETFTPEDPADVTLIEETLRLYYPERPGYRDSVVSALEDYRIRKFTDEQYKTGSAGKGLSISETGNIIWMFIKFLAVFLIVMACTLYGAETFGTYKFFRIKQRKAPYLIRFYNHVKSSVKKKNFYKNGAFYKGFWGYIGAALLKAVIYFLLFSPAYVIAYSFKTSFNEGAIFFMILLGIISNGLLINYTNKFYTYLENESRRGYVLTAIVKNLNNDYSTGKSKAVHPKKIFQIRKNFAGHVFGHIFINARFQYLPAIKEQASFLITGLIIIEMALNIQGSLGYELLRNILYERYIPAAFIILLIFYLVKAAEIAVDYRQHGQIKKYSE